MNIYSQRIQQTMPRQLPSSLLRPMTDDTATQTRLTYSPKVTGSLFLKPTTKATSTQTQAEASPSPKPQPTLASLTKMDTPAPLAREQQQESEVRTSISPAKISNIPSRPADGSPPSPPPLMESIPYHPPLSGAAVHTTTLTHTSPQLAMTHKPPPSNTAPSSHPTPGTVRERDTTTPPPPPHSNTTALSNDHTREEKLKAEKTDLLKTLFGSNSPSGGYENSSPSIPPPLAVTSTGTGGEVGRTPAVIQSVIQPHHPPSSPPPPQAPPPLATVDAESETKKKQLLSKLLAMDNGSKQTTSSFSPPSSLPDHPADTQRRTGGSGRKGSGTSIHSWSEKIQNMHIGRPAYADPYGTHVSTRTNVSSSGTFLTELDGRDEAAEPRHRARHGRRAATGEGGERLVEGKQGNLLFGGTGDEGKIKDKSGGSDSTGYLPSFGHQGQQRAHPGATKEARKGNASLDEKNPFGFSKNTRRVLGHSHELGGEERQWGGGKSAGSQTPFLPRAVNGLHNAASGVMQPVEEDIEELVL